MNTFALFGGFLPTTANRLWVSLYSLYPKQGEVPRCIAHLTGSGRLDSNQRSSGYEPDEIDHFSTPVDVALRSASHTSFPYLYPAFRAFVRLVAVVVGGAALTHLRYLYRCIGNHFQPQQLTMVYMWLLLTLGVAKPQLLFVFLCDAGTPQTSIT